MAYRRPDQPRPGLLIPRVQAKQRIETQIERAKNIPSVSINENHEARRWYEFTTEMLRRIFTTDELADEFTGRSSILFDDDISTGHYLRRLISIHYRLELYPEQIPTAPIATSTDPVKLKILIEKQIDTKRKITAGIKSLLAGRIIGRVSWLIQKFTHKPNPPSFYYTTIVIAIVILLPGLIVAILLDEADQFAELGWFTALTLEICFASLITAKLYGSVVLASLRDCVIDSIESTDNLINLQQWIVNLLSSRKSLLFSAVFGTVTGVAAIILVSLARREFVGFGLATFALLAGYLAGNASYYIVQMLFLPSRLSGYQFELNEFNPSSSYVIWRISRMLSNYNYVVAIFMAFFTLFVSSNPFARSFIIVVLLAGWSHIVAQFVSNQVALNRIIVTAKWNTLRRIQLALKSLQANANLAEKNEMDTFYRLIDFHDKVNATPDSALDIRGGLSFLNQLLLPLVATVLGNISTILQLKP